MMCEVILCQCLGKCVSDLVFCANRKDLDKSLTHVFAKMMVTYVDMLCPRTQLWKPGEFQCARVVLKYFAVDAR